MNQNTIALLCLALTSTLAGAGCVASAGDTERDGADPTDPTEEVATASSADTSGLDLNAACVQQWGTGAYAVLTQAASSPGAAYAWRCQIDYSSGDSAQGPIDLDAACEAQVAPTYIAAASDPNNAYSWLCWLTDNCVRNSDGCSNPPDPTYTNKFHDACVAHDHCYGIPGSSKDACDSAFKAATYATCNYWDVACKTASSAFYTGVQLFGQSSYDHDQSSDAQCTSLIDSGNTFWTR